VAYFEPKQAQFNFLRHLQLMAWDERDPIRDEDLAYYVAHHAEDGRPGAWFFDSFLPFTLGLPSGNFIYNDINLGSSRSGEGDFFAIPSPNPGHKGDWLAFLDTLFAADGFLARLDRVITALRPRLGAPPHKRNVVITIPYPHETQAAFGAIRRGGPRLNFSVTGQNLMRATEQRLEACRWYVDETLARWRRAKFPELHLLGFYWVYESLHYAWQVDDHWLLKELYPFIRRRGSRLFWIPFYSSFNVHLLSDARGFYFDAAFLQPNHIFYYNIPGVEQAAEEARARGAGLEIEYYLSLPKAFSVGREKFQRFRNYLNAGVTHGYMTESACAHFNGFNDLHKAARHRDRRERQCYHDLFHFTAGDYEPR